MVTVDLAVIVSLLTVLRNFKRDSILLRNNAPSEPPTNIHVSTGGPGELHVSWRPPPRDSWHGELLGYTVTWVELTPSGMPVTGNATRSLNVNGWSAGELSLSSLRKFTRYEIRVRAFNGVAAGPSSMPVTATTMEGVPEAHPQSVSCNPLSSVSMKVAWSPPPLGLHGGIIQGYKVIYTPQITEHVEFNVGEVKRITTTETYLHALHKYTNYSIQVLAFTNAGDGKRSPAVYCMTEEDVPSQPQKIKALAISSDGVLVSWLPPLHPNGIISHYTVYHREAGRIGKHMSYTVSIDKMSDSEFMFESRNLIEHQLYEFWVSATTGSGEGEPTPVVAQGANGRAPARIASFGRTVVRAAGSSAVLRCACVGSPVPRSRWTHRERPVTHAPRYQVTPHGHLDLHNVDVESSGNFTCSANNLYGDDSITYTVVAVLPPTPPILGLQYTTASSIKIHWQPEKDGGSPILGYTLTYKADKDSTWLTVELPPDASSHSLETLHCGSTYAVRLQSRNRVAAGRYGETLTASTRGAAPKAPKPEDLVTTNSTAIKLNLYTWRDNGCPLLGFRAEYRRAGAPQWRPLAGEALLAASASHVIGDLMPAQWYEVRVAAINDAGVTQVQQFVDTTKINGGRIPPLEPSSPLSSGHNKTAMSAVLLSCIASVVVIATAVAAIFCVLQGRRKFLCLSSNHYTRDDRKLSESNEAEREKLREGQKLYSSSSINGQEKSNDDSSAELYEISPYATFGLPGAHPVSAGSGAHSLHFRSFGLLDDESSAAPPSHHHRHKHRHMHRCDTFEYDESTLSKSTTVEARHRFHKPTGRATSEGGGGWERRKHRDPPTTTDSDDNSESPGNTTSKGSRCVSPMVNGSGGYGLSRQLPRCSR